VSSTRFEHPSVYPREDVYMQFYCISFMYPYKQSGRWHERNTIKLHVQVFPRTKTWMFRNMSKTL